MSSGFETEEFLRALRQLPCTHELDYVELELSRSSTAEAPPEFSISVLRLRDQLLKVGIDVDIQSDKFRGFAPNAVLGALMPAAPLLGAALGFVLRGWIDSRNGRKLKIRVGEIEVDATQMKETDVVRIFDLLQEKAEGRRIRNMLMEHGSKPQSE